MTWYTSLSDWGSPTRRLRARELPFSRGVPKSSRDGGWGRVWVYFGTGSGSDQEPLVSTVTWLSNDRRRVLKTFSVSESTENNKVDPGLFVETRIPPFFPDLPLSVTLTSVTPVPFLPLGVFPGPGPTTTGSKAPRDRRWTFDWCVVPTSVLSGWPSSRDVEGGGPVGRDLDVTGG